jgi:hypothetical protein
VVGGIRRNIKLVVGAAAAAASLATFASPAAAATIGSDLKPAPNPNFGFTCGLLDPCSVMQLKLPGDPHAQTAPVGGVIEKWRFRKSSMDTYQVRLWVVRRADGGGWTFIRHSGFRTVGVAPGKYAFPAQLKIRKGDRIAVELPVGDTHGIGIAHNGATNIGFFPAPAQGSTAMGSRGSGREYPWNATIGP